MSNNPACRHRGGALAFAFAGALCLALPVPRAAGAPPPRGASALDAWAAWRDAEGRMYRLAEDGVRTFSCRVECTLVDLLAGPGAPLAGDPPRMTLWWRMGEARATVEGGAQLDADGRGRLAALIEPVADMLLPLRPSRSLVAHSFNFLRADDPWLRMGETGLEAVARRPGEDPVLARVAIGPDGLIVRERLGRLDGSVSEFEYEHVLQDGRHLLKAARGTFRGMRVAVRLDWGLQVGGRALPTRMEVEQQDEEGSLPPELARQVFRFSLHQINGEIPDSVLPSRELLPPAVPETGAASP